MFDYQFWDERKKCWRAVGDDTDWFETVEEAVAEARSVSEIDERWARRQYRVVGYVVNHAAGCATEHERLCDCTEPVVVARLQFHEPEAGFVPNGAELGAGELRRLGA